ncbi:hypothetical protein CSIRO_0028 [Bradyrhizobiaceae bacterium SG-6C]|nr:hypothetical protein CSIRO_0028 [Bradyrhizobiaceae bacterium SG-6C]
MIDLATRLYDQAFQYRKIMMGTAISADDFVAEHEGLAERVLSRSGNAAVTKLSAHLERTYLDIYGALPA